MTNKEAIDIINNKMNVLLCTDEDLKALDLAVKALDESPEVDITEEQAIDKLQRTGWMFEHDREMTRRPEGTWIDSNEDDVYCANCSRCNYQIDVLYERGYLKFCPNCGAKMKGGTNAEDDMHYPGP